MLAAGHCRLIPLSIDAATGLRLLSAASREETHLCSQVLRTLREKLSPEHYEKLVLTDKRRLEEISSPAHFNKLLTQKRGEMRTSRRAKPAERTPRGWWSPVRS